MGQVWAWSDTKVLESHGFNVVKVKKFPILYPMLSNRRFDLFPRGANEIQNNYNKIKDKLHNLAIEQNMALYYPWPRYIFTAKGNTVICNRLEKGLNLLIATGQFKEMWTAYHGDVIKNINLEKKSFVFLIRHFQMIFHTAIANFGTNQKTDLNVGYVISP